MAPHNGGSREIAPAEQLKPLGREVSSPLGQQAGHILGDPESSVLTQKNRPDPELGNQIYGHVSFAGAQDTGTPKAAFSNKGNEGQSLARAAGHAEPLKSNVGHASINNGLDKGPTKLSEAPQVAHKEKLVQVSKPSNSVKANVVEKPVHTSRTRETVKSTLPDKPVRVSTTSDTIKANVSEKSVHTPKPNETVRQNSAEKQARITKPNESVRNERTINQQAESASRRQSVETYREPKGRESTEVHSEPAKGHEPSEVHSEPAKGHEPSKVHSEPAKGHEPSEVHSEPAKGHEPSKVHSEPAKGRESTEVHKEPVTSSTHDAGKEIKTSSTSENRKDVTPAVGSEVGKETKVAALNEIGKQDKASTTNENAKDAKAVSTNEMGKETKVATIYETGKELKADNESSGKTNDLKIASKNNASTFDEKDEPQTKALNRNDDQDNKLTLHDLHNDHIKNQPVGAAQQVVENAKQNINNSVQSQQVDLARASTVITPEINISHSVHHSVVLSSDNPHPSTRGGSHIQEVNNQGHKSQGNTDPSLVQSHSTHGAQNPTTNSHLPGTSHNTTGSSGHDPSAQGHQHTGGTGHSIGHGHGHHQGHGYGGHGVGSIVHSKDPNGQSNDPSGHGKDPSGQSSDPSGHGKDPSGQSSDPNGHGKDPSGQSSDPNGHGKDPSGQSSDPNGHGKDPSGQSNDPGNVATLPGNNNQNPGQGNDPNGGQCPIPNNGHTPYDGQPIVVYEERPIRNLATLISEMGSAFGPLYNIWSPWGEISAPLAPLGSFNTHEIRTETGSQISNIDPLVGQSQPISQVINPIDLINDPFSIYNQILSSTNGSAMGDSNFTNSGPVISDGGYSNNFPVIETNTSGSVIPTDNGSNQIIPPDTISGASSGTTSVDGSGNNSSVSNQGINSSNVSDSNNLTASLGGQNGQLVQDVNTPAGQLLNGSVDYWTSGPSSNGVSNTQAPGLPSIGNDPVPSDSSVNGIQNDDVPNHDQLVSGAEHYHSPKENAQNIDQNLQPLRSDLLDQWSQSDEYKHHAQALRQQEEIKQIEELKHRLELIASGMWQEPNNNMNGNRRNESKETTNNSKSKKPDKDEGLMGQIMTLLNDLSKGKKPKANRMYVVKEGDTLESIATNVLFDIKLAFLIYLVNQSNLAKEIGAEWRQTKLSRGMVIYLPGEEEIKTFQLAMPRGLVQGRGNVAAKGDAHVWQCDEQYLNGMKERRHNIERLLGPIASLNTQINLETGRQCIVVRLGDTLRSIALKNPALNDVSLWKLLARCNNLSLDVDAKGTPVAILTRGMVLQLPGEEEITAYRASQAAIIRASNPRKAIAAEVLSPSK